MIPSTSSPLTILVTGSAGRVGRAIAIKLMKEHHVVGLDTTACSTADVVADICDAEAVARALEGVDVVVHTAALHAPQVGWHSNKRFHRVNVEATEQLFRLGAERGMKHFVFTSTTALYGKASTPDGRAGWVDEIVTPQPRSIYHHTKLEAERRLEALSAEYGIPVTVLQMSRCFPEPVDQMAVYRLNRGIDARDVASGHALAIAKRLPGFQRFILSGTTPFQPDDGQALYQQADKVITLRAPELARAFAARGWRLPTRLDRVYDASAARRALGWQPRHGFESVLRMLDEEVAEVLPRLRY